MGILFTQVALLGGFVALGIPILIHLLLKRTRPRIRFSTIQFFERIDERASQSRRLRNLLLLALRLFLLALLVLAFARPFLPRGGPGTNAPRRVVIVLDRSASMQAVDRGKSRWELAIDAARQLVTPLRTIDRVAVVGCGSRATVEANFGTPALAVQKLAELTPAAGETDLTSGLREAARLLQTSEPGKPASIYVVSDFQQSSRGNLEMARVPSMTEVKTVAVGDLFAPNIAITQLDFDNGPVLSPFATLTSFSAEELAQTQIEFSVDGKRVLTKPVTLGARESVRVDLPVPGLTAGWHDFELRARFKDSFALDDVRYQTCLVPEPVRVLLVEPGEGRRVFEEVTFFVASALDPRAPGETGNPGPFNIEKCPPSMLASKLGQTSRSNRWEVVVLPGIRSLPPATTAALVTFVREGGGLFLFAGDLLVESRFNAEFAPLLPATLVRLENTAPGAGWRISDIHGNDSIFAPFRSPNSGDLSLPRFHHRFQVQASSESTVLARFEDKIPFLVRGTSGGGRVIFANTSADTSWNDWPKHKSWVPWVHATVRQLAGRVTGAEPIRGGTFAAGTTADFDFGDDSREKQFQWQVGSREVTTVTSDSHGRLAGLALDQAGVFRLKDPKGQEFTRVAANVPESESNLSAVRAAEFEKAVVRDPALQHAGVSGMVFGTSDRPIELWRLLLLAVLGVLLIETWFSNRCRTSH